ncbi:hypothetical protein FG386_001989 [Cryptosporidium ryanae]|uniref:uncharacterized protein n=1 Tax=Cryptosporidium ryanae TaxID=515981 RepID=UPI00351A24C4|nr:hypothetical protein FG386_001989 [Cryptosporidium ryanae]
MISTIKGLSDVLEYTKNNYGDLIKVVHEQVERDRMVIRVQILEKSKQDFGMSITSDGFLTLEISTLGIRVLNENENESVSYYETVESLFQSVIPDTWFRYFESKIMDV